MKGNEKGTIKSSDPYGIHDSKLKTDEREKRIKAVEDALLETVEEIKLIRSKIDEIETAVKVDSGSKIG